MKRTFIASKILAIIALNAMVGSAYAKLDINNGNASADLADISLSLPPTKQEWINNGMLNSMLIGGGIAGIFAKRQNDSFAEILTIVGCGMIAGGVFNGAISQADYYINVSRGYFLNKGLTLCGAVVQNDVGLVRDMLARGESPLKADGQGNNAFHYAAALGRTDILKILLDWKAQLRKTESEDVAIITFGKPEDLNKVLGEIHADKENKNNMLDAKNHRNRTAAMLAALCSNSQELSLLVNAYADVGNIKDQFGQTVNDIISDKPKLKEVVAHIQNHT